MEKYCAQGNTEETEAGIVPRRYNTRAHIQRLHSKWASAGIYACPLLQWEKSLVQLTLGNTWESTIHSWGKMHKWCPSFEQILTCTEIHFWVINPKEHPALQFYFIHLMVLGFMNKLKGKNCAHYVIMPLSSLNTWWSPLKPHIYIFQLLDNSVGEKVLELR